MTVEPEYLQRVIAGRQGLDLSALPDGYKDEGGDERDEAEKAELKEQRDLKALRPKRTREGQRGKGQVITVEWRNRMKALSKEKAEAEARAGD